MCSKNFCVQAKGEGASPSAPPKYATGGGKWLMFKLGVSAGAEVTTNRPVGLDAGTPGLFRHCRRGVGAD